MKSIQHGDEVTEKLRRCRKDASNGVSHVENFLTVAGWSCWNQEVDNWGKSGENGREGRDDGTGGDEDGGREEGAI